MYKKITIEELKKVIEKRIAKNNREIDELYSMSIGYNNMKLLEVNSTRMFLAADNISLNWVLNEIEKQINDTNENNN